MKRHCEKAIADEATCPELPRTIPEQIASVFSKLRKERKVNGKERKVNFEF